MITLEITKHHEWKAGDLLVLVDPDCGNPNSGRYRWKVSHIEDVPLKYEMIIKSLSDNIIRLIITDFVGTTKEATDFAMPTVPDNIRFYSIKLEGRL